MPRHTRRSASIGQTLKQVTLFETLAHGCLPPTSPHHPRARAKPPSTATTSRVRKRQPDSVLSSPDAESDARRSNTGSDVDAIRLQPRLHTPDDDVKDVSPRNPSLKRRRTVASEPEDNSEDEILPIPRRKRGKNKTWSMRRAVSDSEGEDKGEEESAEGTRPQRRNLVKGVRPLTPEEEDLMGDLDEDSEC